MTNLLFIAVLAVLLLFMVPSVMRFTRGALLAAAAMLLLVLPAAAQEAGGAVYSVIASVTPMLMEILAIILMAVLTWAAAWAKTKFGVDIEAKHRESLHSALMTAARLAAAKQLSGQTALELILDYAKKSVPDALASLRPSPVVLQELAESKLRAALTEGLSKALAH